MNSWTSNKGNVMRLTSLTIYFIVLTASVAFAQTDTWQITSGPYGGPATNIAISSDDSYIAAGHETIHRSVDGGGTWATINNNLPNIFILDAAANFYGDLFVGGYVVQGEAQLYRSINNGGTWQLVNNGLPQTDILSLACTNTDTMFAGTSVSMYRSVNDGFTWSEMTGPTGAPVPYVQNIYIADDGTVFAASYSEVYYSLDSGDNWIQLTSGYNSLQGIAVNSLGNIFIADFDSVFYAPDLGGNFSARSGGLPVNVDINCMNVKSDNSLYIGTRQHGIFRSVNDGVTWSQVNTALTVREVFDIQIDSFNNLVAGTANGIFVSANNGDTWERRNTGYFNSLVRKLRVNINGDLYAGSAIGLSRSVDLGQTWDPITFFDTLEVKDILNNNNGDMFVGTQDHGIFISTDDGASWDSVNTGLTNRDVLAMGLSKAGDLFATTYNGLFLSTNNGSSWNNIYPSPLESPALLIAANDTVYAASYNGIYRITFNGTQWDGISVNSNLTSINHLSMRGDGYMYAGTNSGIFRSENKGVDWQDLTTWTGNPNVQSVLISRQGHVFAATDSGGLYRSTNLGNTWEDFNTGIPNAMVRALALNNNGDFFAGTENQGVYRALIENSIFTMSPTGTFNFGNVRTQTTASDSIEVTNIGHEAADIVAIGFNGDMVFSTQQTTPFTIPGGQSSKIPINFIPPAVNAYSSTMEIRGEADTLFIQLEGNGIEPVLSVTPTSITFSSTESGSTTLDSVLITNTGNDTLHVSNATITGTDANLFAVVQVPTAPIAPDSGVFMQITFTPTGPGTFSATLDMTSDGGNQQVSLGGTGMVGVLSVSPTEINFGNIEIYTNYPRSMTLTNTGSAELTIENATITGTDFSYFTASVPQMTLEPDSTFTFNVTFSPVDEGPYSANLVVASSNNTETIPLSGTGVLSTMSVSPDSLHLGTAQYGETKTDSLLLYNSGGAPIQVSELQLTGPHAAAFSFTDIPPFTIDASTEHNLVIHFNPIMSGFHQATLAIINDGGNVNIPLTGIGQAAQFNPNPGQITFPLTHIDSTRNETLSIINEGDNNLTISDVTIIGSQDFSISGGSTNITPLGSANYTVTFAPATWGEKNAVIIFTSNAPTSPDSIKLSGTGTGDEPLAVLEASPQVITFPDSRINGQENTLLTINNTGNDTLNISRMHISGPDSVDFNVIAINLDILPEDSRSYTVIFNPQSFGNKSASLVIESNAPSSPDSVLLSGYASSSLFDIFFDNLPRPVSNSPYTIDISLDREALLDVKRLKYRNIGETAFQSVDMTVIGTRQLTGTIPAEYIQLRGVEYYFELYERNGSDTTRIPDINIGEQPERVNVRVDDYLAPLTLQPQTYQMIAFPCVINNLSMAGIFSDDYGLTYDPSRWRLLYYSPRDDSTFYMEYSHFESEMYISPGSAFWLITSDGKGFDIDSASTVLEPVTLYLGPGWNMIGNPYDFPISIEEYLPENVELPISYDGNTYTDPQSVLQPWNGYWIQNWNEDNINFTLPPVEAENLGKASGPLAALAKDEMVVKMSASLDNSRYKDTNNYFGTLIAAGNDRDEYDYSEPPPITGDVQLYITQNDHKFAGNFKPASSDGEKWDIVLRANTNENINLNWQINGASDQQKQLYLFDLQTSSPLKAENGVYTISGGLKGERRFKAIIGTEAYAQNNSDGMPLVPVDYALMQNYPNPFNPETRISFQLAEKSHAKLEIYNILGHRVKTLCNTNLATGSHSLVWDGTNDSGLSVAAGVYLYRLTAGDFQSVKKMILVR